MIPDLGDGTLWLKFLSRDHAERVAGAIIPEFVKVFTSTESRHVREVVTSSREGGPSLNILSGLVAGNFSAYWLGITIMVLMTVAYFISLHGLGDLTVFMAIVFLAASASWRVRLPRYGPGHHRRRFVRPQTDNAQSVFVSDHRRDSRAGSDQGQHGFDVNCAKTSKRTTERAMTGATATCVGWHVRQGKRRPSRPSATTNGSADQHRQAVAPVPAISLGLVAGGAIIWLEFTGASMQAVTTGAYRAVEFIKANMNVESTEKASVADSKKVVEILPGTQKGMCSTSSSRLCHACVCVL